MDDCTFLCRLCGVELPAGAFPQSQRFHRGRCRACDYARKLARPLQPARVCRDCGATDAMSWWIDRGWKTPGAHTARCSPCFTEYTRRRQGAKLLVGPVHGPPKPQRKPARSCPDCGVAHHYGGGARCAECALQYRMSLRSESQARRLEVENRGDRDIHWRPLGERDGWTCHLCRKSVKCVGGTAHEPFGATVDHLIPIAAGGEHVWSNVALAHRRCNISRGVGGVSQLRLVG